MQRILCLRRIIFKQLFATFHIAEAHKSQTSVITTIFNILKTAQTAPVLGLKRFKFYLGSYG